MVSEYESAERVRKKRERGQAIEYERKKIRSRKHEKVNGMVKWNYLGHRRTVDPNKVKGMAKKPSHHLNMKDI